MGTYSTILVLERLYTGDGFALTMDGNDLFINIIACCLDTDTLLLPAASCCRWRRRDEDRFS